MENENKIIEIKIIETIEKGDRDLITLIWSLVGIMNVRSNFGVSPEIEDIIKDIQSTHKRYPHNLRDIKRVFLESAHELINQWEKTHEI